MNKLPRLPKGYYHSSGATDYSGRLLEYTAHDMEDYGRQCASQAISQERTRKARAAQPVADEREARDSALKQAKWRFENILERGPSAPTEADAKAGIKAIDAALCQPAEEEGGKA